MSVLSRVVVTGVGAVSPVGATSDELWSAVLQGDSGIRCIKRFVEAGLPVPFGGDVDAVPFDSPKREVILAERAITEALKQAEISPSDAGIVWSTGLESYQIGPKGLFWNSSGFVFTQLAQRFRSPRRMIAMACASGTVAIGEGFRLIQSGKVPLCVTGGSSAMLTMFYLMGFAGLQALATQRNGSDPATLCRPFDRNRCGFALSDGAGALVLESLTSARHRGAHILAEVKGYGVSQDAFDLNRPCDDGSGAELCMRRAVQDAQISVDDIQAINAHGTGTYLGDLAEAVAMRRTLGSRWKHTPVSSVKGSIGHAQAAAGALEAIVAIQTCRTGIVPPTVNLQDPGDGCELDHVMTKPRETDAEQVLSTSFGMGGQNAAIIVSNLHN